MNTPQDSYSSVQAESRETPKDHAPSKIASTDKDALGDRALDEVSGGSLLYVGGYSLAVKGTGGSASNGSAPGG